jgi:uncharacterized membrane protein
MFKCGLILFFGTHLIPSFSKIKNFIVMKVGLNGYLGIFVLFSVTGMVLMIIGYKSGEGLLYPASNWFYTNAKYFMLIACILLATAFLETHIRLILRHPMLSGIIIWSIVHLSVNPDRSSVMLFGSFLVFSVVSIITSEIRGKKLSDGTGNTIEVAEQFLLRVLHHLQGSQPPHSAHFKFDVIAIIIGVISFALLYRFHEGLFGVALT